jgi:hypothetical protein
MGTSSCIFIYYQQRVHVSQVYYHDGYIEGHGAYIFKFLSSPRRITALKKGLKYTTYISENQYEDARWEINHMSRNKSLRAKVDRWISFCSYYTSRKPRCLQEIHKYVDACSGPAVLKLISAATAQKRVTLVHPAYLYRDNIHNTDELDIDELSIDELDIDELSIDELGIDDIITKNFNIGDFNIAWSEYAYMIDLDNSTLKVYHPMGSNEHVCEYSFAELKSFTLLEFIRRYEKETMDEEDSGYMSEDSENTLMFADPLHSDSDETEISELAKKFNFCSTFAWRQPTHLVCTQDAYNNGQSIKNIREIKKNIRHAKWNRIQICDPRFFESEETKYILWHPKYSSS